MSLADSHFDFLGYRFKRSRRGRLMRLIRPKSLRKLRESIKPRTGGKSIEAIAADITRTLEGWYGYFKHVEAGDLKTVDGWIRMRLRSILRKWNKLKGRGRGRDHQRWPNRYFTGLGSFACWTPRSRKSPAFDKEQTTDWRAV